jgi:DNA-binding response OmpR family regulator
MQALQPSLQNKELRMGKIVIVDDDIEICETFCDILKHAGHEVRILNSGAEAFRLLPKLVPDVVLLDMHMPGVSGVLTLSYIRRLSRLVNTKIIIISGHPELAESAKSIWGADLFLPKPISPKQLVDAVTTYL